MTDTPLYDDGRFVVTPTTLSTPWRLYPISHATVAIRRDPLWAGLAAAVLSGAALIIFGDLLTVSEWASLVGLPAALIAGGCNVHILSVDAAGYPRTLIVARAEKIRALFNALRKVRMAEISGLASDFVNPDKELEE